MVLVQSSKLSPPPSLPPTKSILFEPNSHSLALMHTDSSVSLFPCLSFPSPPPLPPKPQTLVPSPSSSSSFLLIHQDPIPKVLFLVASPYKGGSQILLRFYLLQKENIFYKPQVVCNQKGIAFDSKLGVLLDINHGVSIKIVGSVNFFVLHSVSSKKVCVFAVKLIDDGDGEMMKLMRCAVIDCNVPVWSISVSSGVLVLGEDNGVRVFNLRQLVKGRVKNVKGINSNGKSDGKGLKLPNGVVGDDYFHGSSSGNGCNGVLDMKTDKQCVSVKLKSVRCRQDSGEGSACFVAFKREEIEVLKPTTSKAVSIQALSHKKFVILDSMGDLHILCLSAPVIGSNFMAHMRRLPHSMKVQKLAVLPDISLKMQTFWVSDGLHSVHTITLSDMGAAVNSNNEDETQEILIQTTVIQAIFSAEKIQDLIPLGANGILILGQVMSCSHVYIGAQELKDTELVKNQLVLDLEDGLFSTTESHVCRAASYHELENMSHAILPSLEFASCRAMLTEDRTNEHYTECYEDVLGFLFCCMMKLTFMIVVSTFLWGGLPIEACGSVCACVFPFS